MNARWRRGAAAVLAGSVVITLAACSPSNDDASSDDAASVTWWGWDFTPTSDALLEAFEAEHPEIDVTVQAYSYNDYLNALRPGLTGNDGPDVFQIASGTLLENYGPLTQDLGPLISPALGDDWADLFNETATEQLQLDGKQAALPSALVGSGLIYYNNTLVDQLGITVPTTVPEWIETCKTVTAAGYTCLAQGAKDAWVNTDVFLSLANSAEPGYIYDAIAGEKPWTSDSMTTAMEAWSSLFTQGVAGSGATAQAEYPDAFNSFLSNEAVFIALGTFNTPGTMTKAGLEVSQQGVSTPIDGVFLSAPFPAADADSEPTALFGGAASGWAISQNAKNAEAAATLVEFLTAGGGQELIGAQGGFPALLDAPTLTDDVVAPEQAADIERQKAALSDLVGYREIPYPDLATAIGQALSAVAAGTQSPQDALEAIQTASDAVARG
ncbi:ABC transporter substrate-binding protein [Herbiconiux sp. A18JL235]|uniref:ABC transporter substrate-binding protein n=1 Tax=Herbiconiux sp. A18JL235 TaxID=3152363 RepID=A0AB39BE94_9MICO